MFNTSFNSCLIDKIQIPAKKNASLRIADQHKKEKIYNIHLGVSSTVTPYFRHLEYWSNIQQKQQEFDNKNQILPKKDTTFWLIWFHLKVSFNWFLITVKWGRLNQTLRLQVNYDKVNCKNSEGRWRALAMVGCYLETFCFN